jgi:hypothetical protein
MFKSVRIQNFRQFKDLKLDGLAQINLITGKNNTGKTSLLEALWIYAAAPVDPGVVTGVARVRGIDKVGLEGPSAWGWIFGDADQVEGIRIESVSDRGGIERLQLRSSQTGIRPTSNGNGAIGDSRPEVVSTAEVSALSLVVIHTGESGDVHEGALVILGDNALPRPAINSSGHPWYFLSNRPGEPDVEAQHFDQMVLAGRENDVVDAYRLIDPRILDVQSLDPGTGRRVYARTANQKLLPISVMGHGVYRSGKIATAIVAASGGIAMIDEFDDGLHYAVLVEAWKYVMKLAAKYSVQVFATTHSYECLQAAVKGSEDHPGTLAMFRLIRSDGCIRVVDVDDEGLRDAVSLGFEMR